MSLHPLTIPQSACSPNSARPRGNNRLQLYLNGSPPITLFGDIPERPSLRSLKLCEALTGHCPAAQHFFPDTPSRSPREYQTLFRVYRGELLQIDPPRFDNRPVSVCVKIGYGPEECKALEREGKFYRRELGPLQDVAVPVFLGIYGGEDRNMGEIACLLTEYCDGVNAYVESAEEFL